MDEPRLTSDTPCLYLGGPLNKKVEEWGGMPRGRLVAFYNPTDALVHEWTFRFVLSEDKSSVDVVLLDYAGSREL